MIFKGAKLTSRAPVIVTRYRTGLNKSCKVKSNVIHHGGRIKAVMSFSSAFVYCVCSQRKELGVLVYNCSCLALDLHRVFSLYWGLRLRDFIPSFWSKRLFALFNRDEPLELTLNSTKAQAYVSVSEFSSSAAENIFYHAEEKKQFKVFKCKCEYLLVSTTRSRMCFIRKN